MRAQQGSIVEMTLTSYSHKPMYNFHHPMHLHGHEFYVMQKGYGKIDWETMNSYPNGSNPAFECNPGEEYCATTRQVKGVNIKSCSQTQYRKYQPESNRNVRLSFIKF